MLIKKIVAGNDDRRSRLHDEKGNLVPLRRVLRNSPRAVFSGLGRKIFDYRPYLPWISYDAIRFLESFLNHDKTVLEYGSGMSTIWYANHVGQVFSVEDSEPWYRKALQLLKATRQENILYEFRTGVDYCAFMKDSGKRFDLIMIDGSDRAACAASALGLVKDGGIIYLDNSDKHSSNAGGDTRLAEKVLLDFAKEKGADIQYFTDFCPCEFFVQQGMLVKLPD